MKKIKEGHSFSCNAIHLSIIKASVYSKPECNSKLEQLSSHPFQPKDIKLFTERKVFEIHCYIDRLDGCSEKTNQF